MAQAYCFKCRGKREIKNAEQVFLKNNRSALKGVCPVCGGKLSRIGKGVMLRCQKEREVKPEDCPKLDECHKLKMILDKELLDFQYIEAIRAG